MSFEDLELHSSILRAVAGEGYAHPTPIQSRVIPQVIAGGDLIGCAQTGTGKSAAFILPLIHRLIDKGNPPRGAGRHSRVLILAPTRELAVQLAECVRVYGAHTPLRTVVIFGGVSQHRQVQTLRHGVDVIVATPGRLVDLINQGFVDLSRIETLVLDEADRMLDMGFLPDMRRIVERLPVRRQTLMFSATMPPQITALANQWLQHPAVVTIAPERVAALRITESARIVTKDEKPKLLATLLRDGEVGRAIVFVRTKHGADRLVKQLQREGVLALAIHGNKSQAARQRALGEFRSVRSPVLVATDVAARGIDVDGISHVFNFDLPQEPDTYTHRIGRTGRAGSVGAAITFCMPDEKRQFKLIEKTIGHPIPIIGKINNHSVPETPRAIGSPPESLTHRPNSNSGGPASRASHNHGHRPRTNQRWHRQRTAQT